MVLLGLGSNLGESAMLLHTACARLAGFARGAVTVSSFYRTSPVDCPPGSAPFVNAAACFEPRHGLTPVTLLYRLKLLERQFGRIERVERHAPRELDIDLLLFGDLELVTDWLELPHPRAIERRFVLAPAAEILPDTRWPGTGQTIAELLAGLDNDEEVVRLAEVGR